MNAPHAAASLEPSQDPLASLAPALFSPMGVDGVYARTALYVHICDRLEEYITKLREPGTEIMRFPPVGARARRAWTAALSATDLVLSPAACYPLYPLVAARGRLPPAGLEFELTAECFPPRAVLPARSPAVLSHARVRAPRLPEQISAFRERWLAPRPDLALALALPGSIEVANDPFFGRVGQIMALSQRQLEP